MNVMSGLYKKTSHRAIYRWEHGETMIRILYRVYTEVFNMKPTIHDFVEMTWTANLSLVAREVSQIYTYSSQEVRYLR